MSTITIGSGFTALVSGVRQYFSDNIVPAVVHVGVRAHFEQWNQGPGGASRVVFVPGEFHGETGLRARPYGKLTVARHNTTSPREVAQWVERPITISIWAAPDQTAPGDELLQNEQTEALLETTIVACRVAVMSDYVPSEIERLAPPQERAFGECLLVHGYLRGPLFYPPNDVAFPTPVVSRGTVT